MVYDVIVIGGGPAGMAAAINAGAEGLSTLLIEIHPDGGGRAKPSHAIENYFGFLEISGEELMARGRQQLDKFGIKTELGLIEKLGFDGEHKLIQSHRGITWECRDIVIATGMSHKDSKIPGANLWGVFYHAEPIEVEKWKGKKVVVVGGENSATQAALNFANHGAQVTMLMRSDELKMSAYLRPMLNKHQNIVLKNGHTKIINGSNGACRSILLEDGERMNVDAVVLFGGAEPRTSWLKDTVRLDERGFILTNEQFESSLSGVWAVGDVRAGSVKRIASAVGEGTSVIRHIMVAQKGRYFGVQNLQRA